MSHGKNKDKEVERVYRKVYVIINGEKVYIDPEIVKNIAFGFTYCKRE